MRNGSAARTLSTGVIMLPERNITIWQHGRLDIGWAGMEHSSVVHAASLSRPCNVVEAGAHQGSLAVQAAILGCDVWALEGRKGNAALLQQNVALNHGQGKVTIKQGFLGDGSNALLAGEAGGAGSSNAQPTLRIDAIVPPGVGVTLLKMDIDGDDHRAMMGASRLFEERRVQLVNFEFNPEKHWRFQVAMKRAATLQPEPASCAAGDLSSCGAVRAAVAYLDYLDRAGFELFLYSCVPARGLKQRSWAGTPARRLARLVGHGIGCLTYGNYEARNAAARGRTSTVYVETAAADDVARCLAGRPCTPAAAATLEAQRIAPADFVAACTALYHPFCEVDVANASATPSRRARGHCTRQRGEVDLVGRLRPQRLS